MPLLAQFVTFAVVLAALVALSRWISREVQILGMHLSGSSNVAVMGYYLLMFPGILLHELSHYGMARLLGLKVGKFTLGPRRRKDHIELGSVTISSGGPLLDSIVGLAPFLTGTLVLLLVSYLVFDVAALGQAWSTAGWSGIVAQWERIRLVPDMGIWAYVIFVVSNAMMPSAADRQPWLIAGLYLGIAFAAFALLGGLARVTQSLQDELIGTLQILTLAFLFTVALNLVVAGVLGIAELLMNGVRRGA
jgi:hypothetical protein